MNDQKFAYLSLFLKIRSNHLSSSIKISSVATKKPYKMASIDEFSDNNSNIVYYGEIMSIKKFLEWMSQDGLRWNEIGGVSMKNLFLKINTIGVGKDLKFEIITSEEMKQKIQKIHADSSCIMIRFIETKTDNFEVFVGFSGTEKFRLQMLDECGFYMYWKHDCEDSSIFSTQLITTDFDQMSANSEMIKKFDQIRASNGDLNLIYPNRQHYPSWFFDDPNKINIIEGEYHERFTYKYDNIIGYLRRNLPPVADGIFTYLTLNKFYRELASYTADQALSWKNEKEIKMFLTYGPVGFPLHGAAFDISTSGFANDIDDQSENIDVSEFITALKLDGVVLDFKNKD